MQTRDRSIVQNSASFSKLGLSSHHPYIVKWRFKFIEHIELPVDRFTLRLKNEPLYREVKEEIVRESDHTITLKNGKIKRKSDLAVKRQPAPKKSSPRKKNQLVKFYATKGPRKVVKPQRNVGF